jgi:hypothetical protein
MTRHGSLTFVSRYTYSCDFPYRWNRDCAIRYAARALELMGRASASVRPKFTFL